MGVYSALQNILSQAPSLKGVTINWGEERDWKNVKPPAIAVVPIGGPIDEPGLPVRNLDPLTNMLWETKERVSIYCWARSQAVNANIFDHYDAVDDLRQNVLKALQYQRSNGLINGNFVDGAFYKPVAWQWELLDSSVVRMGRAGRLDVDIRIPILDDPPPEVTITNEIIIPV